VAGAGGAGGASGGAGGASAGAGGASAGAGGASAGASSGGSTGNDCPVPNCLETLQSNCPPEGACHLDISTPTSPVLCWENGVSLDTSAGLTSVTTMRSSGGSVCYTIETTALLDGVTPTGTTKVWKDAGGNTVATGGDDYSAATSTVQCVGGDPIVYDTNSDCSGPDTSTDGSQCTQAACPFN
jgi:hypothetical protein